MVAKISDVRDKTPAANATVPGVGPLAGVEIAEFSAFVAAPLAGMTLAQLGASVTRIDPPGGGPDQFRMPVDDDGRSLYWAGLNKGKQSVELNLKDQEDQRVAQALVERAGIVLTNLPDRGWLAWSNLKRMREDLICIRLVGQPDGAPAVDFTVNPSSGFPCATGPSDEPINHVLPAWDVAAGLYLCTGLLAALQHRERTGEGQEVRLSLTDVMLATVANLGYVADVQINGHVRPPLGNEIYGTFGKDFVTADDRRVMVAALTDRQWKSLTAATGLEHELTLAGQAMGQEVAHDRGRWHSRRALEAVLEPWFAARPLIGIVQAFRENGVLFGVYQDFGQLVGEDPWCSEDNPIFARVQHPGTGSYLTPSSPLAFSVSPGSPPLPAPRLGQDTARIRELAREQEMSADGPALRPHEA
ncbi:CoA transferase [Arthrobacter sp. B1I2]|uniref:CoA transferase n=1 Tax=Arthrobacter sp. B1I2 TaxID=3042263 RepID=UPI0027882DBE|nr:CoA transferase [Arthrobacter sp. B1I2]MDQ0733446.1 2-methylfumaryl-CoA isomerase [Arthrobacter sp. B1I2]